MLVFMQSELLNEQVSDPDNSQVVCTCYRNVTLQIVQCV